MNWNICSSKFDLSAVVGISNKDCLPRIVQLLVLLKTTEREGGRGMGERGMGKDGGTEGGRE